jgi:hypothetical protein
MTWDWPSITPGAGNASPPGRDKSADFGRVIESKANAVLDLISQYAI